MKTCERCCRMIRPDEEYTSHDKFSTSGAGRTLYYHRVCPPPE